MIKDQPGLITENATWVKLELNLSSQGTHIAASPIANISQEKGLFRVELKQRFLRTTK